MKGILRQTIYVLVVLVGLFGCQQKDSAVEKENVSEQLDDVLADSAAEVSVKNMRHTEAYGLFDDFIYQFMHDEDLQRERIDFPIKVSSDGKAVTISEKAWTFDSIFSETDEYTEILDGKNVEKTPCDSNLRKVELEVVDLQKERVKIYHFAKRVPYWRLASIDEHGFDFDDNHDFFAFYGKFSNDEKFQLAHVHDPFYFKTFDSDNFQEIEGWVPAESWMAYRTYLPNNKLINTVYDGRRPVSNYRTLIFGSPSSGVSCTLIFKRERNVWNLVRMEN